ncbi:MAG: MltA domain-containing protein [Planctomycetota bacterium]
MKLRLCAVLLTFPLMSGCDLLSVLPTESTPMQPDYGRPLPPGELALEKVTDPALYPDFGAGFGERESLLQAIDGTLEYFAKPSSEQWFPYLDITHERSIQSLEAFREILLEASSPNELNQRIVANFEVYRSKGWDRSGTVLFTGYCQPIYDASAVRTAEFRYPLYGLPEELIKDEFGTPLGWRGRDASPTRAEFSNGFLEGRGLELFWLKEELEAYIVHVQGSAKLRLPDGNLRSIGYAGKTEHEYVGLGTSLVQDGKVDRGRLNLFAIKDYFKAHPEELREYLDRNESYVFFTETEGGPYGSMNIQVTPYRTLATDKKVFPRGGINFTQTVVPVDSGALQPFQQFTIDQDTGGAIRSAGRADIFLGTGPRAERIAGATYAEGKLWYIYVRNA